MSILLDYLIAYPEAKVRFTASDMISHVDSDAAYLVAPKPRSKLNGTVHIEWKIFKHVVASAAEAETSGLFHNFQKEIYLRNICITLGHQQPATPVKTYNLTAASFIHDTLKKNRSKYWDLSYHW